MRFDDRTYAYLYVLLIVFSYLFWRFGISALLSFV